MSRKRILVVDDDPLATGPLQQILAEKGYEVTVTASGEQALELLSHEAIDLVLLDVALPGLSGYEVCRRIRRETRTRDLQVIFLSAHGQGTDVAEAAEAGSDLYLVKPVLATKLLGMVESALSDEPPRRGDGS